MLNRSPRSSNMDTRIDQITTKTSLLLRNSLLTAAVILLSACSAIDNVKGRFTDDGEKTEITDASPSASVLPEPTPLNPRQQLLISIQESLDELGYAPGRTDGKMDSQTEAAIQDFQLDNDMRINGRPSAELLQGLEQAISRRQ